MESLGGPGQGMHNHDRGPSRRSSEIIDKEVGRDDPSCTDGSHAEDLDKEGRDGDRELHSGGRRHRSPLVDSRNNEKQDRGGLVRNVCDDSQNAGPCIDNEKQDRGGLGRDRLETQARGDIFHEARACGVGQPHQHECDEPRHVVDNASGAHRLVALGAHSQQKQDNARDFPIDYLERIQDDSFKEYRQGRSHGDDDISDIRGVVGVPDDGRQRRRDVSDKHSQRREQDVDTFSGDRSRKRGDVNDVQRRRDHEDDVQRRWDADDTRDNHRRHSAAGDKGNMSQGVIDVQGDGWRRGDADDVPGSDSHRRRHNADGVADRRRQDLDDTFEKCRDRRSRSPHRSRSHHDKRDSADDAFENRRASGVRDRRSRSPHRSRRHHDKRDSEDDAFRNRRASGVRDRRSRSPHKSRSHRDKRDLEDDGVGDRFSARFRDAERNEDKLPELFSVHRAKVQSVSPFGVFVRLEGFYKQGLVHLSQLSDHEVTEREDSDDMKVRAVAAVAGVGDKVWVKVISLKDDGGGVKIGCSLKLVSQSTGKDLDPNNLKLEQTQPKGNRQDPKKVTLDAIYNVVCTRCGGHGHLKMECYGMTDKSYELLPEEDDPIEQQLSQPSQTQMPAGGGEVSLKPGYGRGRAMVLPAWMTHGSGANASQPLGSSESDKKKKKRKASELPEKITTVEEAMALITLVKKSKKDKHHRREHRKHKKDRKVKSSKKEKSSSRKDRVRE